MRAIRFSLTQDHPVSFHFSACRYLLSSLVSYWVDSNFGRPPLWHLKLNVESTSNISVCSQILSSWVFSFLLPSSKRSFSFLWSGDSASAAAGRGEARQLRLQTNMQLIYCNEACNLFSFVNSLQLEKPQSNRASPQRRSPCTTACLSPFLSHILGLV